MSNRVSQQTIFLESSHSSNKKNYLQQITTKPDSLFAEKRITVY